MSNQETSNRDLLSFEEVYQRYAADVHRFCFFQLRDAAAAEDVASEVFLSAFKAYPKSAPEADRVRFWLIRIAKNAVVDHQRSNGRRWTLMEKLRRQPESTSDVESLAAFGQTVEDLLRAMEHLQPRQRLLISLRCAADMSYADIAKLTHTTTKAAATATSRAMERLKAHRESVTGGGISV
jgi:RNA polymerase sigma-70 factor (ECF subfamily)